MEMIRTNSLSFIYPTGREAAVSDIDLSIAKGEFITICGQSGCGKSTLLKLLKPSLTPIGTQNGTVLFNGHNINELSQRDDSESIGFIMQDPDAQIVTDKVWHELAFGLESLGLSSPEIRARVAEMSAFFGIDDWFYKRCDELSGGQKQLLNLAAVMVMQPELLLLDEPTSRLDPIASYSFMQTLERLNRELGTTVVLAEHSLCEALPISDRLIVMEKGKTVYDTIPNKAGASLYGHPMFSALPVPTIIYHSTGGGNDEPLTVREGRDWLKEQKTKKIEFSDRHPEKTEPSLTMRDVWFRYKKNERDILRGLTLSVKQGEIYAILGGNGAGKSTALSLAAAINKPQRGRTELAGRAVMLPQEPRALFTRNTIRADLFDISKSSEKISELCELFNIVELLDRHPYDLSGGEQERAALVKLMLKDPDILLLDEPTKGMDAPFKSVFKELLLKLRARGITIVIVSHDIEFCAECADRCGLLFDGHIVSESKPRDFFGGKSFYTTAANRMSRDIIPGAVLTEDILNALGAISPSPPENRLQKQDKASVGADHSAKITPDGTSTSPAPLDHEGEAVGLRRGICAPRSRNESTSYKAKKAALPLYAKPTSGTGLLPSLISLTAALITVLFGLYFLGDRKYYFISLLIIIETLIPFAIAYEKRKPGARELVIVSVLCAIVVAGRSAFFMVPQVKPTLALVVICGAALGGETGFVIGVSSAFISNIFFGQGPWTPWQMFATGLIGLFAGLALKKGSRKRLPIAVFGFFSAILYGGIMNPAAVLMTQPSPSLEMILSSYTLGAPFDLINAVSTVIFLLLLTRPMLEKLDRVRIRYGLI